MCLLIDLLLHYAIGPYIWKSRSFTTTRQVMTGIFQIFWKTWSLYELTSPSPSISNCVDIYFACCCFQRCCQLLFLISQQTKAFCTPIKVTGVSLCMNSLCMWVDLNLNFLIWPQWLVSLVLECTRIPLEQLHLQAIKMSHFYSSAQTKWLHIQELWYLWLTVPWRKNIKRTGYNSSSKAIKGSCTLLKTGVCGSYQ